VLGDSVLGDDMHEWELQFVGGHPVRGHVLILDGAVLVVPEVDVDHPAEAKGVEQR